MTVEQQRPPVGGDEARAGAPVVLSTRQLVLSCAAALIAAQVAFRGWALLGSWFYTDDYRLLSQAAGRDLGPGYLTAPFDSQFMPVGRLLAFLVESTGTAPWTVTAVLTLLLQLVASVTCLAMLITLFGVRWPVVGLLALYLTSALTVPALMWWAASLNQLPLQIVLFAAVACWVRHLRTASPWWLAATTAVVLVGLLSYVKTVLVVALLAYLLLAYFGPTGPIRRVRWALRTRWRSAVVLGSLTLVYAVYYLTQVPSISRSGDAPLALDLAETMLGRSLATGLLGGPWRWDGSNPPVGYADPPTWAVWSSLVVLLVVVGGVAWRRRGTGRAWLLLAGYAVAAYLLLLTSRAPVAGADIGRELRYLTDVLPVAVLVLGLALLPLQGATTPSTPRTPRTGPTPPPRAPGLALAGLGVVVCLGGVLSSASYVRIWHEDNPGERWAAQVMTGLEGHGPVALADTVVPSQVVPSFSFPYNTTSRLVPLLVDDVSFPSSAEDLVTLTDAGEPRRVVIDPATRSRPGPEEGCGWRVTSAAREIPLRGSAFDYSWWIRIGYLASADDEVTVTTDDGTDTLPVHRGLHNLFVHVDGEVSAVELGGLAPGSTMCVDVVEIGDATPGGPL